MVGIKKDLNFKSCQPSADYRLVTSTSCPGRCEYCYLSQSLGPKPYVRVYVNLKEMLGKIERKLEKSDKKLSFEASSSSDPLAVEGLTGHLKKQIKFFATQPKGRLRVVTKFSQVDSLVDIEHNQNTRFRFSLNTAKIIKDYEHLTSSLAARIKAAKKMQEAGYLIGFIIAPLMIYENWQQDYKDLFLKLKQGLDDSEDKNLTFELIMYRYSKRAEKMIKARFPNTKLNFEQGEHKAYGKYVYPAAKAKELEEFIKQQLKEAFPTAEIEYFT